MLLTNKINSDENGHSHFEISLLKFVDNNKLKNTGWSYRPGSIMVERDLEYSVYSKIEVMGRLSIIIQKCEYNQRNSHVKFKKNVY